MIIINLYKRNSAVTFLCDISQFYQPVDKISLDFKDITYCKNIFTKYKEIEKLIRKLKYN